MSLIEELKIELSSDEELWLNKLYEKIKLKALVNYRILRSELHGKITNDFDPDRIDYRLAKYRGTRLSLVGIEYIDPNFEVLKKANQIVLAIRELLLDKPEDEGVEVEKISSRSGIEIEKVDFVLRGLNDYGSFFSGSSSKQNLYSSIDISDESAFDFYLKFSTIEEVIRSKWKAQEEESKKPKPKIRKGSRVKLYQKGIGIGSSVYYEDIDSDEESDGIGYKPVFTSKITSVNKNLCFVLMPFKMNWSDSVYKLISKAVKFLGVQVLRADNLHGQIVIEDIWTQINLSAFVIVEMTDKNPNVMYELGIVHTIGKPAILITQDIENIPFDLRHHRHHVYENSIEGSEKLVKILTEQIKGLYLENYPGVSLNG